MIWPLRKVEDRKNIYKFLSLDIIIKSQETNYFLSCNSDFHWTNSWLELGHVHIQYMEVQSESKEDVYYLCSPWTKW